LFFSKQDPEDVLNDVQLFTYNNQHMRTELKEIFCYYYLAQFGVLHAWARSLPLHMKH